MIFFHYYLINYKTADFALFLNYYFHLRSAEGRKGYKTNDGYILVNEYDNSGEFIDQAIFYYNTQMQLVKKTYYKKSANPDGRDMFENQELILTYDEITEAPSDLVKETLDNNSYVTNASMDIKFGKINRDEYSENNKVDVSSFVSISDLADYSTDSKISSIGDQGKIKFTCGTNIDIVKIREKYDFNVIYFDNIALSWYNKKNQLNVTVYPNLSNDVDGNTILATTNDRKVTFIDDNAKEYRLSSAYDLGSTDCNPTSCNVRIR